jgi:hypothetical protein
MVCRASGRCLMISKHALRSALFLLGIGFLAALIWHSRHELLKLSATVQWPLFALSVLVGTAGYIISGTFFRELLHKYGAEVDARTSRRMVLYSQIIKYIPGRVWPLLYQAALLKGIRSSSAVVFANLDFMMMSVAMVISVSISLLLLYNIPGGAFLCFAAGLLPFLACAKLCHVFMGIRNLLSYFKNFSTMDHHCRNTFGTVKIILFYILFSLTYSLSHFLMLSAIFNFSSAQTSTYIAYLGLGWVVGALTLLVPAGIGVKEFIFVMMAQTATDAPDLTLLTAIAVVSRLWIIAQELFGMLWGFAEDMYHAINTSRTDGK